MAASTTTTPSELIHLTDSFYYSPDFGAILCSEHNSCIDYRLINTHLKNYHRAIKPSEYSTKFAMLNNYRLIIPDAISKPEPFRYYFDKLPEYSNYSMCQLCYYCNKNEKSIRIHLNKEHSINLNTKTIKKEDYIRYNVKVQTLFRDKNYIYYFPTSNNPSIRTIPNPISPNPVSPNPNPSSILSIGLLIELNRSIIAINAH
jgi:Orsellinic acid/F9775 biosynthesis cluster protein D